MIHLKIPNTLSTWKSKHNKWKEIDEFNKVVVNGHCTLMLGEGGGVWGKQPDFISSVHKWKVARKLPGNTEKCTFKNMIWLSSRVLGVVRLSGHH